MRIFVTGGSGFVGSHLLRALSDKHDIRAMARSDRSAEAVSALGATPVRCGLSDVDAGHLGDAEVVVHAAAHVDDWGDPADFWKVNVDGTRRLLVAARKAGVGRFIHIGTEAGLFAGQDLVDIDETQRPPAVHRFHYCETKAEAERLVLAENTDGFATLSLRPRLVWGPGDNTLLPGVLQMAAAGRFVWIDHGQAWTSCTHVGNLVHAIELALTRGSGGQAYFVVDAEQHTMRDLVTALARTAGVELPHASVPAWLLRPLAAVVERGFGLMSKQRPPLTRHAVALMSCATTIHSDRAARELGYAPVIGFEEGLKRMAKATAAAG